jgi:ribose transport system permease protein
LRPQNGRGSCDSVANLMNDVLLKLKDSRVFLAVIGLLLLSLLLSVLSPHFLTVSNILNVLRQISMIAVVAIGMTYVIITGGIDLSVGSVLALSAVCSAFLMNHGVSMYLAILAGIMIGGVCGFLNAMLIVTRINMPPFVATLAMMSVGRGLSMVITEGRPIYGLPAQFGFIAGGYFSGIPVPVLIMILLYLIGHIHLSYVKTGMYFYATGGNEEAARVAGVDAKRVKLSAYVISGFTAALAGMILASRLVSIEPLAGLGYELDAIAAAVIGGANLYGGEGSLLGTLIGAIITGVLRNGLNLLDVSPYWQQVVVGLVIASVVSINALRKKS